MTYQAPPADQTDASIDMGLIAGAVLRRAPRIIAVTVLLCLVTFGVLMFMPRLYESTASVLVEPRSNTFTRATTDINNGALLVDDAQLSSQIELIRSRDTILDAIEATNLRDAPEYNAAPRLFGLLGSSPRSDEGLISAVNDRLVVARERDSRLIAISFRSQDPTLAAEVANAIATAHLRRRSGQQISDTADATLWLEGEIERMRGRVVEAEGRIADFRIENDLYVGQNSTSLLDQQLAGYTSQLTAAAERRNAAQSRARLIQGLLDGGQSVGGVAEVQASAVVQQLSQEIARLQGERAQRSATLLGNHPTIRSLDAQIAELNTQIAAEGRRVASALEAQASIETELEASLRSELDALKLQAGSATRESVTLAELEREAAAQRDLLNAYLIRYSEAASRSETNAALPDVRIVSEAAPSVSPVSPKSTMIMIAVALVSVTLQVGGVIFSELLSGRALVERKREFDAVDDQEPELAFEPQAADAVVTPVVVAELTAFGFDDLPEHFGVLTPEQMGLGFPVPRAMTINPTFLHAQDQSDVGTAEEVEPIEDLPIETDTFHDFETIAPEGDIDPAFLQQEPEFEPVEDIMIDEEPTLAEGPEVAVETTDPADETTSEVVGDPVEEVVEEPVASSEEPAEDALDLIALSPMATDAPSDGSAEIEALAAAMRAGDHRVLVVAAMDHWRDTTVFAEQLGARLLTDGLSLVEIDAASGQQGIEPGLSDLAAEEADFGDVVHKGGHERFAFVPWGQTAQIDRRSDRALTLTEALSDIYESVIIVTGRIGMASTLPLFADLDCHCVLLGDDSADRDTAIADIAALGYQSVEAVSVQALRAEVA